MDFSYWCPQTDLEKEIVALQPELNFVFGRLNDQVMEEKCFKNTHVSEFKGRSLSIMRKVAEIAGTKSLDEQVELTDWDTDATAAREITGMIRHFGMCCSIDVPFQPTKTKPPQRNNANNSKANSPVLLGPDDFKIVSTRMKNATTNQPTELFALKSEKKHANSPFLKNYTQKPKYDATTSLKPPSNEFKVPQLFTPTDVYRRKRGLASKQINKNI